MSLFGNKKSNGGTNGSTSPEGAKANAAGTLSSAGSGGNGGAAGGGTVGDNPGREGGQRPLSGGAEVASIGKTIIFKGELSGEEDLLIEGQVEGRISLPNNQLTIGASGRLMAEINAKSIIVTGQTAGNLTAGERVEVQATGVVEGDIRTPRLLIQEGATVNGTIEMSKKPVPAGKSDPSGSTLDERIGQRRIWGHGPFRKANSLKEKTLLK